jgi:hypothetical protein
MVYHAERKQPATPLLERNRHANKTHFIKIFDLNRRSGSTVSPGYSKLIPTADAKCAIGFGVGDHKLIFEAGLTIERRELALG